MTIVVEEKKENIASIDQILENIKKTIASDIENINNSSSKKNTQAPPTANKENILELTDIVPSSKTNEQNIKEKTPETKNNYSHTQYIQALTHKLNTLIQNNHLLSEREVTEIFKETLRPYLKSWLNNNLHSIVKEVMGSEIKQIFKKL